MARRTPRRRHSADAWPRYLIWRDGRPRWVPSPKLRRAGYTGRDLKDDAGNWLPKGLAIEEAERINQALDLSDAPLAASPAKRFDMEAVAEAYFASSRFLYVRRSQKPKSEKTKREYRRLWKQLPASIHDTLPAAIDAPLLEDIFETLIKACGPSSTRAQMRLLSIILGHAKRMGTIATNPMANFELPGTEFRCRFLEPAEINAIMAAAERLAMPWVADAYLLGLQIGQRRGDILSLPLRIIDENHVRLTQWKTSAAVDAPLSDTAKGHMPRIWERAKAMSVVPHTVIFDAEGQPFYFDKDSRRFNREEDRYDLNLKRAMAFRRDFDQVRALAAKAVPSVADTMFKDTRPTAVTRLALADCTAAQISAISGHEMQSIHQILRHYLRLLPAIGAAAIKKYNDWMEREGIEA